MFTKTEIKQKKDYIEEWGKLHLMFVHNILYWVDNLPEHTLSQERDGFTIIVSALLW